MGDLCQLYTWQKIQGEKSGRDRFNKSRWDPGTCQCCWNLSLSLFPTPKTPGLFTHNTPLPSVLLESVQPRVRDGGDAKLPLVLHYCCVYDVAGLSTTAESLFRCHKRPMGLDHSWHEKVYDSFLVLLQFSPKVVYSNRLDKNIVSVYKGSWSQCSIFVTWIHQSSDSVFPMSLQCWCLFSCGTAVLTVAALQFSQRSSATAWLLLLTKDLNQKFFVMELTHLEFKI